MNGEYFGLPVGSLENEFIRLEYLAEAGPRIVRLTVPSHPDNLLAEMPDLTWDTPYGRYFARGGHRLWHSPESFPRTYVPDNEGLVVEERAGGVRLTGPLEGPTGIRKSLAIRLDPHRPAVQVEHILTNEGKWSVELSPWAITQLPLGGAAVLPQQVGALDFAGLLPNRLLVLWPYTRWSDPRIEIHDDFLVMHGKDHIPPCKIGYMNRLGWVAYLQPHAMFLKRFNPLTHLPFPDYGCNVECYCNDRFMEVETLGPLTRLQPGESTNHFETWEVYSLPNLGLGIDSIRAAVRQLEL